jgi:hypothetical protein
MKTLFRIILIIGLYQILILIQSCCNGNNEFYNVKSFKIESFHKQNITVLADSAAISYEDYMLSINFITEKYSQLKRKLNLGNTAYALDCDENLFEMQNKISEIKITSNVAFSDINPAGSSLNSYFIPYRLIKTCFDNGGTFEKCTEKQYNFYNTLEDVFNNSFTQNSYLNKSNNYDEMDILELDKKPDYKGFMRFYIELKFKDGKILTDSTNIIKIE